jgi:Fe-S-cluster-containing dehydrogenase component
MKKTREDKLGVGGQYRKDPRHRDRRSFLKAAGFSFAGAWAAGCQRAPIERAIPYLIKPDEMTPGRSYFYASTCAGCSAGCGLLVKTRDGRPVKLEGNPDHPLSAGAVCAVGQASILGLYDSQRLRQPVRLGQAAPWTEVDADLLARFDEIRRRGGAVRFLTGTITSPTASALIDRFLASFADARHVVYDPISSSAVLDAYELTHGVRLLPHYRFERASVIVACDADVLGTWISPVEFTRAYANARRLAPRDRTMSYHAQLESRLSVTGGKADRRIRVAPGDMGLVLTHLAARIASRAGVPFAADGPESAPIPPGALDDLVERLWAARGRSLVVCGTQNLAEQVLCNFVNELLGNYGATIELARPSHQRQGSDQALAGLRQELARGQVAALVVAGANPAFDLPDADTLAGDVARVPLVVSFADRVDETAALAHYVCPDHHYLESWGDAEPVAGIVSLTQPAIHPLGSTRSILETLSSWAGEPKPALAVIRTHWAQTIFPRASGVASFEAFWDLTLERGAVEVSYTAAAVRPFDRSVVRPVVAARRQTPGGLTLVLYPKVAMLDGRHAHNAWLHELPDPISKVTWDNYACVSPARAAALGLSDGDVVRLEAHDDGRTQSIELPAFVQPGQDDRIVAVALGYGRKGTDRFVRVGPQWLQAQPTGGDDGLIGRNAAPFVRVVDGRLQYASATVTVVKTGRTHPLACTQAHHTLTAPARLTVAGTAPRPIVQELTFAALLREDASHRQGGAPEDARARRGTDLWPRDHPYTGHRWALAIDLTACTGCSACVLACQVENNVPVVGQDEVRRHREMHWIRLDRYYSGDGADVDVVHQPMLCQHCDHAPCETVCPVLATTHSEEGLSQQVYNRCVGTRYCENNCPYKVRRFNWFEYPREDRLQNLVLNPDVTVRSRGVMEKCSLCVQRIQEARMESRRTGRAIRDGDIQTACQQTCPGQAIVFGDLNDPASRVAQLSGSARAFHVLEELNVRPAMTYLKLVRNRPGPAGGSHD